MTPSRISVQLSPSMRTIVEASTPPVSPASKISGSLSPSCFTIWLGIGAGWKAREIGAGARDRAADCFDERGRNLGIWQAQRDASGIAGDFQRQAMSGFNNESEAAGPKFIGESQEAVRHIANQRYGLFNGIHKDGEGFGLWAAFGAKHSFDGREVKGVDGESVKRVSGNADNLAASDETRSILHQLIFRRFGRNF